jgi:hypothetical protein
MDFVALSTLGGVPIKKFPWPFPEMPVRVSLFGRRSKRNAKKAFKYVMWSVH